MVPILEIITKYLPYHLCTKPIRLQIYQMMNGAFYGDVTQCNMQTSSYFCRETFPVIHRIRGLLPLKYNVPHNQTT